MKEEKFDNDTYVYLFTGTLLIQLLLSKSKLNISTYMSMFVSSLILTSMIETVYFWKPLSKKDGDDPEGGQGKRYYAYDEIVNSVVDEPIDDIYEKPIKCK